MMNEIFICCFVMEPMIFLLRDISSLSEFLEVKEMCRDKTSQTYGSRDFS